MAYHLRYSDYITPAGPPDPASWIGPPGPPGPQGIQGEPGPMPPGGPFLPLTGGTVTGMIGMTGARTWASGAFPGTNPAIYQSVTYTGTTTSAFPGPEGNSVPINLIALSENMVGPTGAGAVSALEIQHNTTGGDGARNALLVTHQIHGTMGATNTSYAGLQVFQQFGANVTGAAAGAGNGKGDAFGLGIMTQVMSGVYAHGVTGIEIDINPHSGSSVDYLVGMQIINFGVLGASNAQTANRFDAMLALSSADPSYKKAVFGCYFGNPQAGDGKGFPITATGSMISSAQGTAGIGIDFSQVTFNTALLLGPTASQFRINGDGTVQTSSLKTTTSNVFSLTSSGGNPIANFGGNGPNYFTFIGGASGADSYIQIAGEAGGNMTFKTASGNGAFGFVNNNNVYAFGIVQPSATVNWVNLYASNAGQPVMLQVSAGAGDANVNFALGGKGTGGVYTLGRVGFQGTTPIAKPTVTGSKGANAALASLLTALANYGLVLDSST